MPYLPVVAHMYVHGAFKLAMCHNYCRKSDTAMSPEEHAWLPYAGAILVQSQKYVHNEQQDGRP